MSTDVGSNIRQRYLIDTVVLLNDTFEGMLPMQCQARSWRWNPIAIVFSSFLYVDGNIIHMKFHHLVAAEQLLGDIQNIAVRATRRASSCVCTTGRVI